MQLIRKDEQHKKSMTIASSQMVALKKEIVEIQSKLSINEKETSLYKQKCIDISALLETSYDQHEEDQAKILKLSENVRDLICTIYGIIDLQFPCYALS